MKRIATVLIVFALTASGQVQGQITDMSGSNSRASVSAFGMKPVGNPFSLLDYSRIRWSHSYSVSFFSGGQSSGTLGMLNTRMFYDFSKSLSLTLNLGIAHTGGSLYANASNNAQFLPGFNLDYHPSKNFRMSISFQRYDGRYVPYGYAPYGYVPYYGRAYDQRYR